MSKTQKFHYQTKEPYCSLSAYVYPQDTTTYILFDGMYHGRNEFFFQWTNTNTFELKTLPESVTQIYHPFEKNNSRVTSEIEHDFQTAYDNIIKQIKDYLKETASC